MNDKPPSLPSFLKLVHIFSVNPHLGPLQISLGRMIFDILKFFFLYTLVLFAFGCGQCLLSSFGKGGFLFFWGGGFCVTVLFCFKWDFSLCFMFSICLPVSLSRAF